MNKSSFPFFSFPFFVVFFVKVSFCKVFFYKRKKNYKELVTRSPRRYCKYAVTKRPASVTGIKPKTIPDKSGSTMFKKVLKSDIEFYTIYIYSNC